MTCRRPMNHLLVQMNIPVHLRQVAECIKNLSATLMLLIIRALSHKMAIIS